MNGVRDGFGQPAPFFVETPPVGSGVSPCGMARWFTADLHLGHANIIRYCDRPFSDVDEMNRALIDRWNSVVADDDEVWVLGDVALGPIAQSLALIDELHGDKVLVAGNHDRCFDEFPTPGKWTAAYRAAGFSSVVFGTTTTVGDVTVKASHFPYRGDTHAEPSFEAHRPTDDGGWLVHGHVHQRWLTNERMINVGVDVWDFYPASENALAGIITSSGDCLQHR